MELGRGGHHGSVDLAKQRATTGQRLRVALGGHTIASGRDRIDDSYEFRIGESSELLGVEPT